MENKSPQEVGRILGISSEEASYITEVSALPDGSGWETYWAVGLLNENAADIFKKIRAKVPGLDNSLKILVKRPVAARC